MRASDLVDNLGQDNNPEWKTIALDESGELVSPQGAIGYRWGEKGKWNILAKEGGEGREIDLKLSLIGDDVAEVAFPYFAGETALLSRQAWRLTPIYTSPPTFRL